MEFRQAQADENDFQPVVGHRFNFRATPSRIGMVLPTAKSWSSNPIIGSPIAGTLRVKNAPMAESVTSARSSGAGTVQPSQGTQRATAPWPLPAFASTAASAGRLRRGAGRGG